MEVFQCFQRGSNPFGVMSLDTGVLQRSLLYGNREALIGTEIRCFQNYQVREAHGAEIVLLLEGSDSHRKSILSLDRSIQQIIYFITNFFF